MCCSLCRHRPTWWPWWWNMTTRPSTTRRWPPHRITTPQPTTALIMTSSHGDDNVTTVTATTAADTTSSMATTTLMTSSHRHDNVTTSSVVQTTSGQLATTTSLPTTTTPAWLPESCPRLPQSLRGRVNIEDIVDQKWYELIRVQTLNSPAYVDHVSCSTLQVNTSSLTDAEAHLDWEQRIEGHIFRREKKQLTRKHVN